MIWPAALWPFWGSLAVLAGTFLCAICNEKEESGAGFPTSTHLIRSMLGFKDNLARDRYGVASRQRTTRIADKA